MPIMDDFAEQEVRKNKALRGYIIRLLLNGSNNSLLVRQIINAMIADNLIVAPDISKYLDYLTGKGYIEFTDRRVNAYNAFRRDAVIHLTNKGTDLAEGTIEDGGVEV